MQVEWMTKRNKYRTNAWLRFKKKYDLGRFGFRQLLRDVFIFGFNLGFRYAANKGFHKKVRK